MARASAEHVAVERGAVAVAADGLLHGVAGVDGPEEAVGVLLGALPVVVDADERGQERGGEGAVAVGEGDVADGGGHGRGVLADEVGVRAGQVGAYQKRASSSAMARRVQPAGFGEVEGRGVGQGAEVGEVGLGEPLGDDVAGGRC